MRRSRSKLGWSVGSLVVVAAVGAIHGENPPEAAELVRQAIEFHGGRAALEDWPHLELDGELELGGRMAGRSVALSMKRRADGAYRQDATLEFSGRRFNVSEIFDGQVRKRRFRVGWDDLPLDEPLEEAEHGLAFLLAVADRDPVVTGEGTEADVPVWYVEVEDGRDKARLGLAQDDARLVSIEFPGTKAEGLGTKEEVVKKFLFRDYRSLGALRYPYDQQTFDDGTPDWRLRVDEASTLAVFDPAWLEIPDPTDRFIPSEELEY